MFLLIDFYKVLNLLFSTTNSNLKTESCFDLFINLDFEFGIF
jgi:hypothetical protein